MTDGAPVILSIRRRTKIYFLPNFFQEASCFHLSMEWTPLDVASRNLRTDRQTDRRTYDRFPAGRPTSFPSS